MVESVGKKVVFIVVGVLMFFTLLGLGLDAFQNFTGLEFADGFSEGVAKYVFGIDYSSAVFDIAGFGGAQVSEFAAVIIFLLFWLMIFVILGDIVSTFGSFDEGVAWTIALCMSIIVSLLGVVDGVVGWTTTIFIWTGSFALFVAGIAIIIAFLAVQTGFGKLTERVLQRKTMNEAVRDKRTAEDIKNDLENIRKVGEAFRGEL